MKKSHNFLRPVGGKRAEQSYTECLNRLGKPKIWLQL